MSVKYLTKERVTFITGKKNELNNAINKALATIRPVLTDDLIGKKIYYPTNGKFTKFLPLQKFYKSDGFNYNLFLDENEYLTMRIRVGTQYVNMLLAKAEKGVLKHIYNIDDREIYDADQQWEKVQTLQELEKKSEEIKKTLIYELYS